ncbi:Egg cell-secreted protein 1.1 [Spatholobus suberectus]|nr:Egg cell-secreted protein 1.1 [Spatholobus suberectus]
MASKRKLCSHSSLAARLKLDGESANCWDSLFELQACTGEVITFFLNGETYLGPSYCQAIRVVGHDCWPDMLASMGFTFEEGDVLQGYCDAKQEQTHSLSSPSSPTATF